MLKWQRQMTTTVTCDDEGSIVLSTRWPSTPPNDGLAELKPRPRQTVRVEGTVLVSGIKTKTSPFGVQGIEFEVF